MSLETQHTPKAWYLRQQTPKNYHHDMVLGDTRASLNNLRTRFHKNALTKPIIKRCQTPKYYPITIYLL